jgi:hypothetical protein
MLQAADNVVHLHAAPSAPKAKPRRRRIYAVMIPAAALSVVVLGASLSYAGVLTLPKPIRSVYATIGFHLPEPAGQTAEQGDQGNPVTRDADTAKPGSVTDPASVSKPRTGGDATVGGVDADKPVRSGDGSTGTINGDSPGNPGTHCDLPKPLCGL